MACGQGLEDPSEIVSYEEFDGETSETKELILLL